MQLQQASFGTDISELLNKTQRNIAQLFKKNDMKLYYKSVNDIKHDTVLCYRYSTTTLIYMFVSY